MKIRLSGNRNKTHHTYTTVNICVTITPARDLVLSRDHLLTNRYCGLNPPPNILILFLILFFHVLDFVYEFRMNLTDAIDDATLPKSSF
jgi:hypothetical protein